MHREWAIRLLLAVAVAIVAAVAYAPHLPRLVWEGYPQAVWPAPGSYATVAGGDGVLPPLAQQLASPDAGLLELFRASEGRALLAMHDGKLVMEHYASGVTRETRLNSYSLIKSIIAALTLKAIAEGKIQNREVSIGSLLPELSNGTGEIPLCRLLDMRSGLMFEPGVEKQISGIEAKDIEASKINLFGPMGRLHMEGLAAIMPSLAVAGQGRMRDRGCRSGEYNYQNVNTALAGAILERAYGRRLQDIVAEKIWAPAGAGPAQWRRYDDKLPVTPYCCLFARPIDWMKIAQFLLDNGGPQEQFLPHTLWQELMGGDISAEALHEGFYRDFVYHNVLDRPGQGLQGRFAYFFGSRGQAVYLMPEKRLAVVRFGGKVQLLHSTLYGVGRSIGLSSK